MKKMMIWVLAAALLLTCFGCKKADTANEAIEQTVGGWKIAESTAVSDEHRAMLEKALEGMVGASYEPIAYLGSQLVSGLNHCLLCTVTPVVPDAQPHYALVFLYANWNGDVTLMNVADLNMTELITGVSADSDEPVSGGWNTQTASDDLPGIFAKAFAARDDVICEPVVRLATQGVAGLNRCVLCRYTVHQPESLTYYALVTVYEDLQGNAEVLDVKPFDFSAYCTYGAEAE